MAPHPKKIDAKKKVDWSCKFCTKHAQKVTRAKGHLNYASDDFCRECGEHKREAHLCAYTELQHKLTTWNGRGGQGASWGASGAASSKAKDKAGANKSNASQKVSELQKKLKETELKLKEATGGTGSVGAGIKQPPGVDPTTAAAKDRLAAVKHRKSLNVQWMKSQREEHIEPGANDEEKKKLGEEFDSSKTLLDCKAKDVAYQVEIDNLTPKATRARNFDTEIAECGRQQKAGENNVKQAQEAIDKATKRLTDATAAVKEQAEKMVKLKADKESFLLAQGVKANSFDSFFEGDHWASLRKNATVGKKATELMRELDELNKLAVPTIDLIAESTEAVLPHTEVPEHFDEDMIADEIADDVAEAQEKAIAAGLPFGKTEVAAEMKKARAKAKAAGRFNVISRGKKTGPKDKPVN